MSAEESPELDTVTLEIDDISEDDPEVLFVAKAIAEYGIGRPWDDFLPTNVLDVDHGDLIDYARAAVAAIRALAIKPAPAGEGNESEMVERAAAAIHDTLRHDGVTYADCGEVTKHPFRAAAVKAIAASGLLASHAPAVSPVQGVDAKERTRIAYEEFRAGFHRRPGDPYAIPCWEDAERWIRDVALVCYLQGKLDATPQAPSTVDERVKK